MMKPYSILLVEDMPDVLEYNRQKLTDAGYAVLTAQTLAQAKEQLAATSPDLLVLDILLPDGSGMDLCREVREATLAPILFLTSLGEKEQVVQGLRAGGDDYITKPYQIEELLARIEAQLRRTEQWKQRTVESLPHLTLDTKTQRAFMDGKDLLLKPKEYLMLAELVRNRARYLTAEHLYTTVWGMDSNEDLRTVLVHISSLRNKLKQGKKDGFFQIQRFSKQGYRLLITEDNR